MTTTEKHKRYQIVFLDPPWSYSDKCHAGQRGVDYKYSTMTLEELKRLNIPNICADNCAMFMWATAPQMPVAIELMKNYGFVYKTIAFTWIKHYVKSGKLTWGMGSYTRSNPEFVLLGMKGKLKRLDAGVHSVIQAPRLGHSEKPHEVNNRIVRLYGDLPRIELFARHPLEDWDCLGTEINGQRLEDVIGVRPNLEYRCPNCSSNEIQEQFWIDINTDKPTDREGSEKFFCCGCGEPQKEIYLINKDTNQIHHKVKK